MPAAEGWSFRQTFPGQRKSIFLIPRGDRPSSRRAFGKKASDLWASSGVDTRHVLAVGELAPSDAVEPGASRRLRHLGKGCARKTCPLFPRSLVSTGPSPMVSQTGSDLAATVVLDLQAMRFRGRRRQCAAQRSHRRRSAHRACRSVAYDSRREAAILSVSRPRPPAPKEPPPPFHLRASDPRRSPIDRS
jgi:hypothetical protein